MENCCYDILKFSSVFLLYADNESFKESLNLNLSRHETSDDIDKIVLNIPDNIGDNHSVANKWAMYRWLDMIKWDSENVPQIIDTDFKTSLFFKYLDVKYGKHDKFKRDKKIIHGRFQQPKKRKIIKRFSRKLFKVISDK